MLLSGHCASKAMECCIDGCPSVKISGAQSELHAIRFCESPTLTEVLLPRLLSNWVDGQLQEESLVESKLLPFTELRSSLCSVRNLLNCSRNTPTVSNFPRPVQLDTIL